MFEKGNLVTFLSCNEDLPDWFANEHNRIKLIDDYIRKYNYYWNEEHLRNTFGVISECVNVEGNHRFYICYSIEASGYRLCFDFELQKLE